MAYTKDKTTLFSHFPIFEPKLTVMKKIGLLFLLTVASTWVSWSQNKIAHFSDATIETAPDQLLTFSNDSYIVLIGKNEIQPGAFVYNISWVNIQNNKSGKQMVRSQNRIDPNFFGFHFNKAGFVFFEESTNEKAKTNSLIVHELHLEKGALSNSVVLEEKLDFVNKKNHFARTTHQKILLIYSLVEQSDGAQLIKSYVLDYNYKITEIKTTRVKNPFDFDFNSSVQITDDGMLLGVVQLKNEKLGEQLMFQYGNVLDAKDESFNELKLLYNEKGKKIHDFKVYLNDESFIEFVGIYNHKTNVGLSSRMVVRNFHPLKEKFLVDKDFELNAPQDIRIHSLLPISKEFFVLVTKADIPTKTPEKKEPSKSISLSQNKSIQADITHEQVGLAVNYFHVEKGLLWKEVLKNDLTADNHELIKTNKKASDYYFWCDGKTLFALFNQSRDLKNTTETERRLVKNPAGIDVSIQHFDLNSGKSQTSNIDGDERFHKYLLLPSCSGMTSVKFLTTVMQLDKKTFYPIQLYMKY